MPVESRLLVVDDEEAICEGCSRIFTRQGFGVEKCSDACKGLTLATQSDYSAILLDVKMPGMDGIHFLEALRKTKPKIPVVLMTGYPSIPTAASAIRLGVSDYVTKPFTPEEISQAVHRLLQKDDAAVATPPAAAGVPATTDFRFYHETWYQAGGEGAVRVGTILVRPGASKIESVRLPRIGEVVYQGLPLAAVTVAGQPPQTVPAPLSGVVVDVNEALGGDPAALLTDPCGQGWIACISPTRPDEEAAECRQRRVVLLSRDRESAKSQAEKLRWLGCDVRAISDPLEFEPLDRQFDAPVLIFDGTSFGSEGPNMVGDLNAKNASLKIIVLASTDSILEPAYRIRRIFYYAVEPFADNEIADILAGAFQPQPGPALPHYREFAQALGGLFITNRNGTRVRLVAAPGLLRHEEGLGQLLRQKLIQRRFPLESTPSEMPITPMELLSLARHCDRVIVLLAQDSGRLPGSLTRDTKAEYVSLAGAGADKVATLLVQPGGSEGNPLSFEPATVNALAEHLVREMAEC